MIKDVMPQLTDRAARNGWAIRARFGVRVRYQCFVFLGRASSAHSLTDGSSPNIIVQRDCLVVLAIAVAVLACLLGRG